MAKNAQKSSTKYSQASVIEPTTETDQRVWLPTRTVTVVKITPAVT